MLFHLRLTLCYMDTSKTWFKGPKRLNKKNILIKIWSRTKRTEFQNKNGFGHFENWTYCFVLYSLGNSEFFSRDYPTRNSILKRVLLKRSKNFRPSAVRLCPSPSDSPPTVKNFSWHCPCPMSDLVVPIQWGQSYTMFTGLAPGRTSDRGNVRRSFLWSDGWADGWRRTKRDVKTSF